MGNLYAESALCPVSLQNSFAKKFGMTGEEYTAAVNSGKYKHFITDNAGYGLAQWTYPSRKQDFLVYVAFSECQDIGDLENQLGFLLKELDHDFRAYPQIRKSML